jgi:hypothetical protein
MVMLGFDRCVFTRKALVHLYNDIEFFDHPVTD